jgi:hypothetical protein
MDTPRESDKPINERALRWMRECLAVARKKTLALMRNDLQAIEECTELEAKLVSDWQEVAAAKRFAATGDVQSRTLVQETLNALAVEMKTANRKNAALTRNGLEFSQALLGVIRPATTYSPFGTGMVAPPSTCSIISIKG